MHAESWERLARAVTFYERKGFKYRDVSWVVSPEISAVTKPKDKDDFYLGEYDVVLVGSAEQGFIADYHVLDNDLYYAITPCFRDEEETDKFRRHYFMKLELFTKDLSKIQYLRQMALKFFTQETNFKMVKNVYLGKNDYDLEYRGIEIGSYNIKEHKGMSWACGTGLAEPRFTEVLRW